MSELQSNELNVDNDEYMEVDGDEFAEPSESEASELATDNEPQHEQNSEEPETASFNQEAVNKVINKKHYEAAEAKRQAEEYKRQLDAIQSQQQSHAPVIPEAPDPYDDDYESKMAEYRTAIEAKGRYDAEQRYLHEQQQMQQQQQQQELMQKQQEAALKYVEAGKKAGMSIEEMTQAGQAVEMYGIGQDLQNALLSDEDGPLIVKHLAANPALASSLSQMQPFEAALYIERTVRSEAKQLKPKSTNAPTPTKRVASNSVSSESGRYGNISGATFE